MAEQSPQLKPARTRNRLFTPIGITMLVPFALAVMVLSTSPNFRAIEGQRTSPFGGDFLQEWIGAKIIASTERARLYDLDHFKSTQHDSSLTGFEWKRSSYYPPVYSPGYYLLMTPFASMNYRAATISWLLISLAGLLATLLLLFRYHSPSRKLFPVLPIAIVFFSPLLFSLSIGHKSVFLLLIFTSTYLFLFHKKPLLAGACFGLIAFKPHLIVLIAIVMLCKRNWSFIGGLAATCGMWLGLCLLAGAGLTIDYVGVLSGTGDYLNSGGYKLEMAHSSWSFFQMLFGTANPTLAKLFGGLTALGIFGWLLWLMRGSSEVTSIRFAHQFSGLMIATVLVSPHFYQYDLTILLLPIVLGIGSAFPVARDKQRQGHTLRDSSMICCLIGYGLFAGLFAGIAQNTSIQFGTIYLIIWLAMLSCRIARPFDASEKPVEAVFSA